MNTINKSILEYNTGIEIKIQQKACIFIMAIRDPKTKTDENILAQFAGVFSNLNKDKTDNER
jgi:hypothetical protein